MHARRVLSQLIYISSHSHLLLAHAAPHYTLYCGHTEPEQAWFPFSSWSPREFCPLWNLFPPNLLSPFESLFLALWLCRSPTAAGNTADMAEVSAPLRWLTNLCYVWDAFFTDYRHPQYKTSVVAILHPYHTVQGTHHWILLSFIY